MNAISRPPSERRAPPQAVRSDQTFASLITTIEASPDLNADQKRVLVSDLRTVPTMLGLSPAEVRCDAVWLNQHVFRKSAASFGKSKYRFQNIKSSVRKAMRLAGLHQPRICGERDLPPEWIAVLDAATFQPQRAGLRRLAQYCVARDVPPNRLLVPIFAAFLDEEAQTRLSGSTTKRGAQIARAWNQAIASSPDLADCQPLQPPRKREPYVREASFYGDGANFSGEFAVFEERMRPRRGRSIIKGRGPGRRARDATVRTRSFAALQAAAALVHRGHDPAAITGLRYLVDPIEHVDDIIDFVEERARARLSIGPDEDFELVGSQIAVILDTLVVIARQVVGLEAEPLRQLVELQKSFHPRRETGLTGKVRKRLLQLIQPYNRSRLLVLAEDIAATAKAGVADTAMARRMRTASAIDLLLACPLRMQNLAGLRLDRHLLRLSPGGRWITHISIPGTEMKGHAELEWPVPPSTARLLETWIRTWRPLLMPPGTSSPYLFPGENIGAPISNNALASSIKQLIGREIGVEVHPHLLRHFAAWRHLTRHPGQYEIVRRALGHASVETTIACYCGLEAEAAARAYHRTLEDDQVEARRVVRARKATKPSKGSR